MGAPSHVLPQLQHYYALLNPWIAYALAFFQRSRSTHASSTCVSSPFPHAFSRSCRWAFAASLPTFSASFSHLEQLIHPALPCQRPRRLLSWRTRVGCGCVVELTVFLFPFDGSIHVEKGEACIEPSNSVGWMGVYLRWNLSKRSHTSIRSRDRRWEEHDRLLRPGSEGDHVPKEGCSTPPPPRGSSSDRNTDRIGHVRRSSWQEKARVPKNST